MNSVARTVSSKGHSIKRAAKTKAQAANAEERATKEDVLDRFTSITIGVAPRLPAHHQTLQTRALPLRRSLMQGRHPYIPPPESFLQTRCGLLQR